MPRPGQTRPETVWLETVWLETVWLETVWLDGEKWSKGENGVSCDAIDRDHQSEGRRR